MFSSRHVGSKCLGLDMATWIIFMSKKSQKFGESLVKVWWKFFFFFFFHFVKRKKFAKLIERIRRKKIPKFVFPKISYSELEILHHFTDEAEEEENKKRDQTHVITIFGKIHRPSSQYRCCLPHLLLQLLACCCCCCGWISCCCCWIWWV